MKQRLGAQVVGRLRYLKPARRQVIRRILSGAWLWTASRTGIIDRGGDEQDALKLNCSRSRQHVGQSKHVYGGSRRAASNGGSTAKSF